MLQRIFIFAGNFEGTFSGCRETLHFSRPDFDASSLVDIALVRDSKKILPGYYIFDRVAFYIGPRLARYREDRESVGRPSRRSPDTHPTFARRCGQECWQAILGHYWEPILHFNITKIQNDLKEP